MKRIISGLIFTTSIFLVQASLFSGSASAQEGNGGFSNSPGIVPLETQERLRAIYEDRAFSARSFRPTWHPVPGKGANTKLVNQVLSII